VKRAMQELKYDIRRGADTYSAVYHPRLKSWILKGIINREEALVWRSGLSGWRRPEELEELKPYFEKREKEQLRRTKVEKVSSRIPQKEIQNILIIDDEEDLCWLLASALSGKGYNAVTANTLQQSIALLKENPDLIFLDLKLPDGDGMDILPIIEKQSPEAFVVVISGYGSEELKEDASDKGVYSFIDKPFTEEKIMRILERFQRSHAKTHG
jgi:CheY-like chemotaxis protein